MPEGGRVGRRCPLRGYISGVLPWRLRVPEGGRGQGDVHHQAWQARRCR